MGHAFIQVDARYRDLVHELHEQGLLAQGPGTVPYHGHRFLHYPIPDPASFCLTDRGAAALASLLGRREGTRSPTTGADRY